MWGSKVPRQPRDTCSRYPGGPQTKICCSRLPRLGMSLALFLAHCHAYYGSHGYYQSGSWTTLRIPDNAAPATVGKFFQNATRTLFYILLSWMDTEWVCPRAEQAYSLVSRSTCGPCYPRPFEIVQDNK